MSGKYDDIINLPHPVSRRHARMPMVDRGAQFSPFAALTGYDAVIRETARQTCQSIDVDESVCSDIDRQLRYLAEQIRPEVTVTYFQPDERKAGGAYVTVTGRVKKVDPCAGELVFLDGSRLPFESILAIQI